MPHFAVCAVSTGVLTLAAGTHQACRRTSIQNDAQMLDSSAICTYANGWHLLLLSPCYCLLIVVIGKNTN